MDRVIAQAQGCRDPPTDPEVLARVQSALQRTRIAGCLLKDVITTSLINAPGYMAALPPTPRARPAPIREPQPVSPPGPPVTSSFRAAEPALQAEPPSTTPSFLPPPPLFGGPCWSRPIASGFRPVPIRPTSAGPARALSPSANPAPVTLSRGPLPDPPEGRAASPAESSLADSDISVVLASRSASPPGSDYGSALASDYASDDDLSDSDASSHAAVTPVTPPAPSPTQAQTIPGSPTPPPTRPTDDWEPPSPAPPRRPIRWPTQVNAA